MKKTEGKFGTGSVLSLDAIGKQDTYLIDKDNSLFISNHATVQHSKFAITERTTRVDSPGNADSHPNWPFGQEIVITLKPRNMSDLLSNMFLKCELPVLKDKDSYDAGYTDQLGRTLIDTASFRVDTIEIEKLHNDWGIIRDELFLNEEQKDANKFLINAGQDYGNLPGSRVLVDGEWEGSAVGSVALYIPLNFFFTRKHARLTHKADAYFKPYFPLCAITKNEIKLTIVFNPVSYFARTRRDVSLSKFEIVTEEITVTDAERYFLQTQATEITVETVRRNPVLEIFPSSSNAKMFLVSDIPIKSIFWFFRDVRYDRKDAFRLFEADVYLQRYNFSASSTENTDVHAQKFYPIMSDATLVINGKQEEGFMENLGNKTSIHTSNYFKHELPRKYKMSSPNRNIYTYSFALDPLNPEPTGAMDFSKLPASRSFIEVSLMANLDATRSYNMHVYYTGYKTLKFADGHMSIS